MFKQHARNSTRVIGGLIIYSLAFVYIALIIFKNTNIDIAIKAVIVAGGIILGIILYLIEVYNGIFNKAVFNKEGIEIKNIRYKRKIYWSEVTSIRLLCEQYDLRNGLNERYYCVYYNRDNVEYKELISYSIDVDTEIRKYYAKSNVN